MDAKYINPILDSTVNVLKTMAKLDPKVGTPELKKNNTASGDISGIMTMVSDKVKGSLAITFTKPAILDIAKRILNEEFTRIDDTIIDLTGEFTNMVTGGAKATFDQQGYNFSLSTPIMVSGENHTVEHKSNGPIIMLPFTIEAGLFFIEVCFE